MFDLSRIKTTLEPFKVILGILALVVSIALGVAALWQQLWPSKPLVGEILETSAAPPAELLDEARALPVKATDTFLKDDAVKEILPAKETRDRLRAPLTEVLSRYAKGIHSPLMATNHLTVCKVSNQGSTTLSAVQLSFPYWVNGSVTIRAADGTVKNVETKGIIDLGDLRPGASIEVCSWGFGLLAVESARLTHHDGLGELRVATPVPQFIAANNGVFFSFRHTTFFLLAVILAGGAIVALTPRRRRRTTDSESETRSA